MTTTTIPKIAKKDRILYWVFTSLVVLTDSFPAIFFNSPMAIAGTRHLGFPDYFRVELSLGKIIGGILLLIPAIPDRVKEWVYIAFGITNISALIANIAVDGVTPMASGPLIEMGILIVAYIYFHKTRTVQDL